MATGNKRKASNELALFPVNFPAGTIVPFAGGSAPEGWALCDGSTVSRSTYASLYLALGDAWGEGDGSTTFHLPDLRGRFLRGVDAAAGNDPDAGSRTAANTGGNTGDDVGSVQNDQFDSHNHSGTYSVFYPSGVGSSAHRLHAFTGGTASSGGSVIANGGTETRPKNANVNYIIKL